MEISSSRTYKLDGGNISICRHFGEKEKSVDIVKSAVAEAARRADILTLSSRDDIMNTKFREPSRQTRRSESSR